MSNNIPQKQLDAGEFGHWLQQTRRQLTDNQAAQVPCDTCNACCRAGYFIHVAADEVETLAHIPAELLFAAPGSTSGDRLMGFDESGSCPMLRDNRCTIYQHRPRTCRSYDCRVFTASGIAAGDTFKAGVNQQVTRWRFKYTDAISADAHAAVQAAAEFLIQHRKMYTAFTANETQTALTAIRIYPLFLSAERAADTAQKIAQVTEYLSPPSDRQG